MAPVEAKLQELLARPAETHFLELGQQVHMLRPAVAVVATSVVPQERLAAAAVLEVGPQPEVLSVASLEMRRADSPEAVRLNLRSAAKARWAASRATVALENGVEEVEQALQMPLERRTETMAAVPCLVQAVVALAVAFQLEPRVGAVDSEQYHRTTAVALAQAARQAVPQAHLELTVRTAEQQKCAAAVEEAAALLLGPLELPASGAAMVDAPAVELEAEELELPALAGPAEPAAAEGAS